MQKACGRKQVGWCVHTITEFLIQIGWRVSICLAISEASHKKLNGVYSMEIILAETTHIVLFSRPQKTILVSAFIDLPFCSYTFYSSTRKMLLNQ